MVFEGRMMPMIDRPHDEAMIAYFRAHPAYAEALLAEVRQGGDLVEGTVLLRQLQGMDGTDSTVDVSTKWKEHE